MRYKIDDALRITAHNNGLNMRFKMQEDGLWMAIQVTCRKGLRPVWCGSLLDMWKIANGKDIA